MAWYYGSDTGTAGFPTCKGAQPPFYIGKIGAGKSGSENSGFNESTAQSAGSTQTFAFWDLEGPGSNTDGLTMTQWGTAQAQAFVESWQTGYYGSKAYLGGTTFFLDIESGNDGWSVGTETDRQQILNGSLDYLSNVSNVINGPGSAGVYTSPSTWTEMFGNYISPYPFVFWYAGTDSPNCTQAQTEFSTYPQSSVGGWKTMIWQFESSAAADFDITPYEGYWTQGYWSPIQA